MADEIKHDEGCSGLKDFTDGIFDYCECGAKAMVMVVGAKIWRKK